MSSVDKDTNVLNINIEAVVMTQLLEKKVLTTERVKASDEVHTHTYKIATIEDIDKGTDEVHKRTEKITTSEEVEKGSENWRIRKRQWSRSVGMIKISLRVSLKDLQDGLILIVIFQKESFLHLNRTSIKTLRKGY